VLGAQPLQLGFALMLIQIVEFICSLLNTKDNFSSIYHVGFYYGDVIELKKNLNRHVLTDEIYTLLKEQILSLDIAPGEKINIDQLGRDLEVSNIPIREALSRLTVEGFVSVVPFKGMYASEMSLQELDEIYEIRTELESMALRKAISVIPDAMLDKLEQDMQKWMLTIPTESDDVANLIFEMNRSLHGLILDQCGNHSLKQLINTYIERIQRYSAMQKDIDQEIGRECEEHMLIVKSLVSRDLKSAEQALLEHLKNSHAKVRSAFK